MYNRSIDFIRCQKRKEIYTCRNSAENPFFLTTYNSSQVDTEMFSECSISSYLSQLPHREKQVVKLKLEGYDTKSIAQFMKIDVGTVRKYWFKAKKRIRVFLESQSDN